MDGDRAPYGGTPFSRRHPWKIRHGGERVPTVEKPHKCKTHPPSITQIEATLPRNVPPVAFKQAPYLDSNTICARGQTNQTKPRQNKMKVVAFDDLCKIESVALDAEDESNQTFNFMSLFLVGTIKTQKTENTKTLKGTTEKTC